MRDIIEKDPFRLFFPLGCLWGLLGNGYWLLYLVSPEQFSYQPGLHRELMIGGFLTFFVVGFLMTAIPRFTETHYASITEIVPILLTLLTAASLALLGNDQIYYLAIALSYLLLGAFGFRRFKLRKQNPPYTFIFVGAGLLTFGISALLLSITHHEFTTNISYKLFFHGGILSLVMGVGGRLIPGILGHSDIVMKQRAVYEQPVSFFEAVPLSMFILLIIFVASFFIETLHHSQLGPVLRAGVVVFMAIKYWQVTRFPKDRGVLQLLLWTSAISTVLGTVGYAIFPAYAIQAIHLMYISGFSLMTLTIASRVTLAHGQNKTQKERIEKKSKLLIIIAIFIMIAAATRLLAGHLSLSYLNHLAYAALMWVAALLLWMGFMIPKMIKR